ncbi:hypothetical protein NL676_012116 [Syzygium grande]|nr:hypothetical protein NL676_012116 [Syzygium grande]
MKTPLNWENAPSPLHDTTAKVVFIPEDTVMGWLARPEATIVAARVEVKFKGMHNCCVHSPWWRILSHQASCQQLSNHFQSQNHHKALHVNIKPETTERHGYPMRLSKATLSPIKEKSFSDNRIQFPLSMTVYDGEKNIFSVIPLPCGKYEVKIFSGENSKESSFRCTVTLVNKIKLCKLKDYLARNLSPILHNIWQGKESFFSTKAMSLS